MPSWKKHISENTSSTFSFRTKGSSANRRKNCKRRGVASFFVEVEIREIAWIGQIADEEVIVQKMRLGLLLGRSKETVNFPAKPFHRRQRFILLHCLPLRNTIYDSIARAILLYNIQTSET